jgi:hypothetical protein
VPKPDMQLGEFGKSVIEKFPLIQKLGVKP